MLNTDLGQCALIPGQRDEDLAHVVHNGRSAVDRDTKVVCFHRDPVAVTTYRYGTVHPVFIGLFPDVPSREIPGVVNMHVVFGMLIGFPVLAVQPKKEELPEIVSAGASVI